MSNDNIIDNIKNEDYKSALNKMETVIKNNLIEKLKDRNDLKENCNEYDFTNFLNYCINKMPDYYDILTHIRNIYFFSEKTEIEKLNELANIYKNLRDD